MDGIKVIPANANDANIVQALFDENSEALHCESIGLQEWHELLSRSDPDEKHFLICKHNIPVGYMKINGLLNKDTAWISMLFISKKYQRQGIGTGAVAFAEKFIKLQAFSRVCIQTTDDNNTARALYEKCGYAGLFDAQKRRWYYTKVLK